MTHIYYGDGKGKTSAALGLALRASGASLKTLFISFLKDNSSAERFAKSDISFYTSPKKVSFLFSMGDDEKNEYSIWVKKALSDAEKNDFDVVVLDEILDIVGIFITEDDLLNLVLNSKKEFVLTGHKKFEKLFNASNYVTFMKKEKHPFDNGEKARKGIEY